MSNVVEYKKIRVQTAIAADAEELAPLLRPADLAELKAIPGAPSDPAEALIKSVMETDDCYVAQEIESGKPICIFGVKKESPRFGSIWLMGSDLIEKHKWTFLKESKKWLWAFHGQNQILGNYVMEANTLHVQWLKWLKFRFLRRHKGFGKNGEDFIEFVKCVTP